MAEPVRGSCFYCGCSAANSEDRTLVALGIDRKVPRTMVWVCDKLGCLMRWARDIPKEER